MIDKEAILLRYRSGSYSPEDLLLIEKAIESGQLSLNELEDMGEVMESLEPDLDQSIIERMDQNYYNDNNTLLVDNPINNSKNFIIFLSAIIFLLTALCFYLLGSQRLGQKQEATFSPELFASTFLSNDRVEERIELISQTNTESTVDQTVLDVLLFSLISDKSINVRLASLNQLREHIANPFVRKGLIDAITFQDSPVVILYIKDVLKMNNIDLLSKKSKENLGQIDAVNPKNSLKSISL